MISIFQKFQCHKNKTKKRLKKCSRWKESRGGVTTKFSSDPGLDPGPEGKNAKKRITEAIDEIGVWTADLIKPLCQC